MASPQIKRELEKLPPLESGDHLDQKTFHERYEAMPKHVKAELIGGIVYIFNGVNMPSPLKLRHGESHPEFTTWLTLYKAATPGTRVIDNATTILSESTEVQPDAGLIILPEYGGRTKENEEGYLVGGPEFLGEVALTSASYDLGIKKQDYERAGVQEYLVVLLAEQEILWFVRRGKHFYNLKPGADGIFRSKFFGGLWLDPDALLRCDTNRVLEVLRQGLASPEHARFLKRLKKKV